MPELGHHLLALAACLDRTGRELLGERKALLDTGQLLATASDGTQHHDPPVLAVRTQTGVRSNTEVSQELRRLADLLQQAARGRLR